MVATLVGAILIAAIVMISIGRESPQAPTEVWVPTVSLDRLGDRPLDISAIDVRTSPDGGKLDGWRGVWDRSLKVHRPLLLVYPEAGLTESMWLMVRRNIRHDYSGGYSDSGDRRDVGGTNWARMKWLDVEGLQRFFNDDD